jgi:4-diphosphocytidyl-2-C-methyl-D-erythritol kinase
MNDSVDTPVVTCEAPAKLNLYLHVTGQRSDGYHLLDTLIAFTEFGDTLQAQRSDTLSLEITGPFAATLTGPTEENLILRAARMLADAAGIAAAARISLTKRIPVAAGLGGGSADAAAILKALIRLWQVDTKRIDLAKIAISLGADVPVCIAKQPSFVTGVGEQIDRGPSLPIAGVLLVNPNEALPTADAFAAFSGPFSVAGRFTAKPRDVAGLVELLVRRRNDLTPDVLQLCPAISDVLDAIEATPGCRLARMTGSGATFFGLFDDRAAAEHAVGSLRDRRWWVMPTVLAAD